MQIARDRAAYLPLKAALIYVGATFAAFLILGQAAKAPDLLVLAAYVTYAMVALAVGYGAWVSRHPGPIELPERVPGTPRKLIFVCASYYFLLSGVYLANSGTTTTAALWAAVTSPGEAYFAKLHPDQAQESSLLTQGIAVLAVLAALMIPLAVTHWRRLGLALQIYVVASVIAYLAYYLSIGTQKGLGETLIIWGAAYLAVRKARVGPKLPGGQRRKVFAVAAVTAAVGAFLWYMSYAQADRLAERNQTSRFPGNPAVAAIVGPDLASGIATTIYYPTHGYLGLSYNLQTPFEWTYGIGSMPAVADYAHQYLGFDAPLTDRYTARTALISGWPDGMYWSTIFPWLASDLTYPGAVVFMGLVGWFAAKWWHEARAGRTLSLALFCQLAILIAYIPANNQLGQSRPALFGVATLALLSVADRIRAARRAFVPTMAVPA